ncbi:aminoglycoside phosphotransferase family protein [Aggregatibacter actinomycetemcomitans]|nr:aminoglycoside phosphotransferase family protein [Aggregatibacter actinomycetemcomitans]
MLTHADKQLIARDNALPGLAALLDPSLLLTELQRLPQLKSAVKIQVKYLRYKPANSCACTLRVQLSDGRVRYYFAKALTAERFEQSWQHPKRQALVQANDPHAPLAIFALKILLQHPAYDRGIGHLGWLINDRSRRHLLSLCRLTEDEQEKAHIDILRYKPERRLVAKVKVNDRPVALIRCTNSKDFGRMLTGAAFGTAQGNMQLLGMDSTLCTLITDWQPGRSLCPEDGYIPTKESLSFVAERLAQLHRTAYRHPIVHSAKHEIKAIEGVFITFQAILPEYAPWFARLAEQTREGLLRQPEHFTLIHGDFSLDQVVQSDSDRTQFHILDWDRAAYGNPLFDLATFQARLALQVIEGVLPHWQATELLRTFLQRYQTITHTDLDGLSVFTAAALLRLVAEPFRKRAAQWEQQSLQLLQWVAGLLNKGNAHLFAQPQPQMTDFPLDPMLAQLTDPQQMQRLLMPALPKADQGQLQQAVLCRYKPQRRALVDYVIMTEQGEKNVIGKYRAKGLDKRALNVQQALWNTGFNDHAKVGVAEPLGALPAQHTWLQRKINGQSVGEQLFKGNERLAFLGESVAHALGTLHHSHVAQKLALPVWGIQQELDILRNRLTQAQTLLPHLSPRIANVLAGCERLATTLTETRLVSVHRDFYQDQIMERYGQPGNMVLLDLDLLCLGDAALDAGNYLAHIQEFALRQYGDNHALQQHQNAFLTTFLTYETTAKENIAVYTTLSLARHIYLSTQFTDRKHTTEPLLAICEMLLTE